MQAQKITPEVYAGFGTSVSDVTMSMINDGELAKVVSGPNWLPTLTGNLGARDDNGKLKRKNGHSWYCLDLLGKYHRNSNLKQFHALTFYFRDTNSGEGAVIASMLPESFTYTIGGKYGTPVKFGQSEMVSAFFQELSNGNLSLQYGVDTAQIWNSTKQMDIVFRIPVFDDSGTGTHINYQEAIDLFGEAILPEIGADGQYESTPGPSIITALEYRASHGKHTRASSFFKDITTATAFGTLATVGGTQKHWDRISVQVGGMLLMDWCIIKDLKVTFPNTKAMVLHNYRTPKGASMHNGYDYYAHLQPLQAELEVTVSTVMGITRMTFKDMLYLTESIKDAQEEDVSEDKKALSENLGMVNAMVDGYKRSASDLLPKGNTQ